MGMTTEQSDEHYSKILIGLVGIVFLAPFIVSLASKPARVDAHDEAWHKEQARINALPWATPAPAKTSLVEDRYDVVEEIMQKYPGEFTRQELEEGRRIVRRSNSSWSEPEVDEVTRQGARLTHLTRHTSSPAPKGINPDPIIVDSKDKFSPIDRQAKQAELITDLSLARAQFFFARDKLFEVIKYIPLTTRTNKIFDEVQIWADEWDRKPHPRIVRDYEDARRRCEEFTRRLRNQ
jgi:hypothetical protein